MFMLFPFKVYLDHPEERDRIEKKGCKEIRIKHTYLHRIREMLEMVKSSSQ